MKTLLILIKIYDVYEEKGVFMIYLNGKWEIGVDRNYSEKTNVPGLPYSAKKYSPGYIWYKKEIEFPDGDWRNATLILKGARFMPTVYINGTMVSETEGGMTVTRHLLKHKDVKPNAKVTLEIRLTPLDKMPLGDASRIPEGDLWRSDLSSHLWDDVILLTHGDIRVDDIAVMYDKKSESAIIQYRAKNLGNSNEIINFKILDGDRVIGECEGKLNEITASMKLRGEYELWSCDNPKLYTLECFAGDTLVTQKVGFKYFEILGKKFTLNSQPITLRMCSVVWHRFLRGKNTQDIAFDTAWFKKNIVDRLKKSEANTLRFHLGMPPERILDLCDECGILVQAEWSFFHELKADKDSLYRQWLTWAANCAKHPSVCICHPWNEIDDVEMTSLGMEVAEKVMAHYPQVLLSHRDVIHMHAYWWSLFENLGLYYDSADYFDKPLLADEFGGNYIDENGNEGDYPDVPIAFERFLGKERTKEDSLWLQTMANAKVAEYWRRINVAGYSPFCALGSPEDGNTHFLGDIRNPLPKPVWEAILPAYKKVAVSMNVWDRNFEVGQKINIPVQLFNETDETQEILVTYKLESFVHEKTYQLEAFSTENDIIEYIMPDKTGEFRMSATCGDASSVWDINVVKINVPTFKKVIGVEKEEKELIELFEEYSIKYTNDLEKADIIVGMEKTKLEEESIPLISEQLKKGKTVIMLGAGPQTEGGVVYNSSKTALNKPYINGMEVDRIRLPENIDAVFAQVLEGESCIHCVDKNDEIWNNINKKSLWLWNGRRGGLIVPSVNMDFENVSGESFLNTWSLRGADVEKIKQKDYFVYSCIGLYEFSVGENENIKTEFANKVKRFLDDAPNLKEIAGDIKIEVKNLSEEYEKIKDKHIVCNPLICSGKKLARIPAVHLQVLAGNLIIMQLIYKGRLTGKSEDVYGLRRDPVAVQLLLNIINRNWDNN